MNPSSPLFALIIIIITFLTGYLINSKYKFRPNFNRFETIDGLRGFLAICVFIHHSCIWHKYLQTGIWTSPDSKLFTHLGHSSVSLFFMISSFLFINILINFKGKIFNWNSFFVKRFYRLAPLHFFSVLLIILIVFIQSNWSINTNYDLLLIRIIKWFGFGIIGQGNINGLQNTFIINGAVLWSLSYEWLLYFSLPLISLVILRSKPSMLYLIISLTFLITVLQFRSFSFHHILSLIGGAIAPLIIKFNKRKINFNNYYFSIITIISLFAVVQFESPKNVFCKILIILPFTLIALGNDLFGLLKSLTIRFIGEFSYSTYLLHGILIFISVNFIFGLEETKQLSQLQYCIFIFLLTPFLILISFLTFNFIEKPFMGRSKHLVAQNNDLEALVPNNKIHPVETKNFI